MARKGRSKRFFSGLLGLALILVSALTALYALNSSKGVPGQEHTFFYAKFDNTGDLHPDADLREADFRIGRVDEVEYAGDGKGTVHLQADDTRPIYKNATVQIVSRSGLGQKYLNVNRGTPDAGQLEQNGTIPATQTQSTVEVLDLAQIFDKKTTAAAQDSLATLGAGTEGHARDLSDAVNAVPSNLPKLGTVARALNNDNGADINLLLSSVRNLSSGFAGRQQQVIDLN
jgi:phospholipid/cholesterol/gamma-HCH transport system substrate-binding protein